MGGCYGALSMDHREADVYFWMKIGCDEKKFFLWGNCTHSSCFLKRKIQESSSHEMEPNLILYVRQLKICIWSGYSLLNGSPFLRTFNQLKTFGIVWNICFSTAFLNSKKKKEAKLSISTARSLKLIAWDSTIPKELWDVIERMPYRC